MTVTEPDSSALAPVFVGGVFRSGTSLLRAMLGEHSSFFAGLETKWCYQTWSHDAGAQRDAWLSTLETFYDFPAGAFVRACADRTTPRSCLDRVMQLAAERAGRPRWVEKTPGNVLVLPDILDYWPTATVLHIIRDPRDVFASLVRSGKWDDPAVFAGLWVDSVDGSARWAEEDPRAREAYRELIYEDLVADPVGILRPIVEFVGEPWEDSVADFRGRPQDFEIVKQALGHHSTSLEMLQKPLTTERVGRFEDVVSPELWAKVEREVDRRGALDRLQSHVRTGH